MHPHNLCIIFMQANASALGGGDTPGVLPSTRLQSGSRKRAGRYHDESWTDGEWLAAPDEQIVEQIVEIEGVMGTCGMIHLVFGREIYQFEVG